MNTLPFSISLVAISTVAMVAFRLPPAAQKSTATLTLHFENIENNGTLWLALYSCKAHFMDEKKASLYGFEVKKAEKFDTVIENLPVGDYAFAVFLDENNNRKLDKNLLGIPIEAFGFSNNPKVKWSLPGFEDALFKLEQSKQQLTVRLQKWKL